MTLNGVMAIILRCFAEFGSFRGLQLRKSDWLAINRFSHDKCPKVHQLSTTDALYFSRYRSFLYLIVITIRYEWYANCKFNTQSKLTAITSLVYNCSCYGRHMRRPVHRRPLYFAAVLSFLRTRHRGQCTEPNFATCSDVSHIWKCTSKIWDLSP